MTAPESDQGSNGRTPGLLTEAAFCDAVIEYAQLRGWLCHHDRPARTQTGWRTPVQGSSGFPDLVLVRGGRVIFAELKSARGKTTAGQGAWLDELMLAGLIVRFWRPENWDSIEETLR